MRDSFYRTFDGHILHGVHDLRVLRIGLETENDEAGEAGACEKFFTLFLDFGGVHAIFEKLLRIVLDLIKSGRILTPLCLIKKC